MIKIKKLFPFLLLPWILTQCDPVFDVTSEWKEIPVIYAILDATDSIHYVRIEKAFLGDSNALDIAQVHDSIYYSDSLRVTLKPVAGGPVYELIKVNGEDHNLPKDLGTFANSPNVLYRVPAMLDETKRYVLTMINTGTGLIATSQTVMVNSFSVFVPNPNLDINLGDTAIKTLRWASAVDGKVYDADMVFTYREWPTNEPNNITVHRLSWPVFSGKISDNTNGGSILTAPLDPRLFYGFLATQIPMDASVTREAVDFVDFHFYGGAEEFWNFVRVREAQSGIAANEALPFYTNIDNGLGIFSSRYTQTVELVPLHPQSIDSLACGQYTRDLNFLNSVGSAFCN